MALLGVKALLGANAEDDTSMALLADGPADDATSAELAPNDDAMSDELAAAELGAWAELGASALLDATADDATAVELLSGLELGADDDAAAEDGSAVLLGAADEDALNEEASEVAALLARDEEERGALPDPADDDADPEDDPVLSSSSEPPPQSHADRHNTKDPQRTRFTVAPGSFALCGSEAPIFHVESHPPNFLAVFTRPGAGPGLQRWLSPPARSPPGPPRESGAHAGTPAAVVEAWPAARGTGCGCTHSHRRCC